MSDDIVNLGSKPLPIRSQPASTNKKTTQDTADTSTSPRGSDTVEISYRPVSTVDGLMEELNVSQEDLDRYVELAMAEDVDPEKIKEVKQLIASDGLDIDGLLESPDFLNDLGLS